MSKTVEKGTWYYFKLLCDDWSKNGFHVAGVVFERTDGKKIAVTYEGEIYNVREIAKIQS